MSALDEPDSSDEIEAGAANHDAYYRGRVIKLFRGAQRGVIRGRSGRDVPFAFAHVTMVGAHRRFEDLREGLEVGYDVSWTSRGLRVSVIRIPD
jgi:hypothetical protein